jgi:beta-lactamase class A
MEEQTPQRPGQGSRRNKNRPYGPASGRAHGLFLGCCAAALAVLLAAALFTAGGARSAAGEPAAPGASTSAPTPTPAGGHIDAALDSAISAIIGAHGGYQIGVALIDLSDGAVHEYGVNQAFVAASTAKVLAAAAFYHLVESGKASLDDQLGDWTAGFQLKEMIQDSDNDSWSLIMDAVGHQGLSDYAQTLGISYDPQSNTLTPAEMARILSALYSGTLLNPDDTAQLLSYMQDTNNENLIPAAVPADITVFHKYGLLGGELHDAAVLSRSADSYAFVVYTKGDGEEDIPERTEIIHELTRAVTGALF